MLLAATGALALAGAAGCAGNCATGCPPLQFDVVATSGENLNLASAQWSGPACPAAPPKSCGSDPYNSNNYCVRLSIIAVGEGNCRLDLTFNDGRTPFSATAVFGAETHQGCCHGFPISGATSATVPPLHPVVTDAGGDQDGGADVGTGG